MDTGTILFGSIIGSVVWLWILYMIIKSATNRDQQIQFLKMQTRLLSELVKKQGVNEDEVLDILNLQKDYFKKKS